MFKMRTDASGRLIQVSAHEQQENIKNTRKTFKQLQQTATDKENLVGRALKSSKDLPLKALSDTDIESKKKKLAKSKFVQTCSFTITETDLTSEAGPSENYWEVVAEKRRVALDETLEENLRLHEENEALKEENRIVKEMLEESKNLVEVLTEMLNETNDETIEPNETKEQEEESTNE